MSEVINTNAEVPTYTYPLKFAASARNFVTNRADASLGVWEININSVDEFIPALWTKARPSILRRIQVEPLTIPGQSTEYRCSWVDEEPTIDKIEDFVGIVNESGHRGLVSDWKSKVSDRFLRYYIGKTDKIHVYKYSSNVAGSKQYDAVEKQLLSPGSADRAGAASTTEVNSLVQQLKDIHHQHYTSFDINWMIWANYIQSQPAHHREVLIQGGPPPSLCHLFQPVSGSAQVALSNIVNVNQIGLHMLDSLLPEIARAKTSAEDTLSRLTRLEERVLLFQGQFRTMTEVSTAAVETTSSRDILARVTNQADIEHMEDGDNLEESTALAETGEMT